MLVAQLAAVQAEAAAQREAAEAAAAMAAAELQTTSHDLVLRTMAADAARTARTKLEAEVTALQVRNAPTRYGVGSVHRCNQPSCTVSTLMSLTRVKPCCLLI